MERRWSALMVLAAALAPCAWAQKVEMVIEGRGRMVVELYPEKAPKTVARFLALVDSGFYNGVRFHRVVNSPRPFIIVTGDPLTKSLPLNDPRVGTGGSGQKIPFEKNDLKFTNGTLGMVRDVSDETSADSQFFICNGDQQFLEGTYTAFGRVVEGLGVIKQVEMGDRVALIRRLPK
ncbi:MAG: peptidylprolyl isomerase [Armatimonadota bacterium]